MIHKLLPIENGWGTPMESSETTAHRCISAGEPVLCSSHQRKAFGLLC